MSSQKVDQKLIKIRTYSSKDKLKKLDFTEDDNTDPLDIADFIKTKSDIYHSSRLTSMWSVIYRGKLVGFFAISMNALATDNMHEGDRIKKITTKRYPAILLGQMGIDKKFRNRDLGYWVCQHCIGLGRRITPKVACKVIMLHTNEDKSGYYEKKLGFKRTIQKTSGRITMYKRIW